jgi:predicted RNA binding protein YcfA (HicA-like mRNA interferase family)
LQCAAGSAIISGQRDEPAGQADARLRSRPKDFTWEELVRLLEGLGYIEAKAGKSGGSRRRFVHPTAPLIALHKPHPGNIVKMYVIDDVLRVLTEEGLI